MNKPVDLAHPKMLLDPYASWAANEGVPVTEDFGVDLLTADVVDRMNGGVSFTCAGSDGGIVTMW